jgi:tetratricopeptide (TPR) repeat protein
MGKWITGYIELLAGRPDRAELELRWGYEALERLGVQRDLPAIVALLADAVYLQGRYEEAEELTRVAEDAAAGRDAEGEIVWRRVRAKILARRSELEQAERLARDSVALAQRTDSLNVHGDALLDLAEILRLLGRRRDAAAATQRALRLYERKGNTVSAEKALEAEQAIRSSAPR